MEKVNFTAFDFETATNDRMPCQLGLVVVRKGQIIEEKKWLIKPPGNRYDVNCIRTHRITPDQTVSCPEFGRLWPEIKPYFDNEVIVSHNLDFDYDVLDKVLSYYNLLDCRPIATQCTMSIYGKRRLEVILTALNLAIKHHHDALEDARACAQIFMAWLNGVNHDKLNYPEQKKKRQSFFTLRNTNQEGDIEFIDLSNIVIDNDFFSNKNVLLSGEFEKYPVRKELISLLKDEFGATIKNGVSGKLNFFIVGLLYGGVKMRDILELKKEGKNIQIINEKQLYVILNQITWQKKNT
jgi:DNA polymerase-3 subunit epsilon